MGEAQLHLHTHADDERIAWLTIQHPERRNAMTRAMWQSLPGVLRHLPQATRCLIVRGQGDHFCAGGDISEYPGFRFEEHSLRAFHENDVGPALEALLGLDIPVVAMISGHCMGGGMEIASCADIRIASSEATFGAPIAKLGMPMALRELEIVLRAAGEATVREMLLEAKVLAARQLKERGFLHQEVASADLLTAAVATASRMAALSPQAASLNKQFLRVLLKKNSHLSHTESTQGAMEKIANESYRYAASGEHREGITAFLEKRTAQF